MIDVKTLKRLKQLGKRTPDIKWRCAVMAIDWQVRKHAPAWLRLAGLTAYADELAELPEITDFAQCSLIMPALNDVRCKVDAVWAAARYGAGHNTRHGWDAAAVGWEIAGTVIRASWDSDKHTVWVLGITASDAVGNVAWSAAGIGASMAAEDVLDQTASDIQQSAHDLVHRMIAVRSVV
jgi:hypothetical protein